MLEKLLCISFKYLKWLEFSTINIPTVDKPTIDSLYINAGTIDGKDSTDLQNYNNLTNAPTIPSTTGELTNDSGSNWTSLAHTEGTAGRAGTNWLKQTEAMIMDITNVSTQKMRFRVDVDNNSVTTQGNSTKKQTGFDIFRLGDT